MTQQGGSVQGSTSISVDEAIRWCWANKFGLSLQWFEGYDDGVGSFGGEANPAGMFTRGCDKEQVGWKVGDCC